MADATQVEDITQAWLQFLLMTFPQRCLEVMVGSIPLYALTDTAVDCLVHFIRWNGHLERSVQARLEMCIRLVQTIVLHLDERDYLYFAHLLDISEKAIAYQENITEEELARRHQQMRYYRITGYEGLHSITWGTITFWFEINESGHADRQIEFYANGNSLSYDQTHESDKYGGLQEMIVDGDEEWWAPYAISKEEFEQAWNSHVGMNRDPVLRDQLGTFRKETRTIAIARSSNMHDRDDDDIPF